MNDKFLQDDRDNHFVWLGRRVELGDFGHDVPVRSYKVVYGLLSVSVVDLIEGRVIAYLTMGRR